MRARLTRFAIALFATTAMVSAAHAQASYPCVNEAPNPYKQVTGWEKMPRAWGATNNVYVDARDNVWVMDRCGPDGCLNSMGAPIWQLSADGTSVKNFGAGMFAFPHTVKPDADGNIWAIDGDARNGKGNQVFKFSPGRPGADDARQGGPGRNGHGRVRSADGNRLCAERRHLHLRRPRRRPSAIRAS